MPDSIDGIDRDKSGAREIDMHMEMAGQLMKMVQCMMEKLDVFRRMPLNGCGEKDLIFQMIDIQLITK